VEKLGKTRWLGTLALERGFKFRFSIQKQAIITEKPGLGRLAPVVLSGLPDGCIFYNNLTNNNLHGLKPAPPSSS